MGRRARPVVDRFWGKVNRYGAVPAHASHLGNCWLWTDAPTPDGYGILRISGKNERAHRVSFALANNLNIETLEAWVLHHCDTPMCVRPEHLFEGDALANNADRDAKKRGRAGSGSRHGTKTHPEMVRRGEAVNSAKLTAPQVAALRAAFTGKHGEKTALAKQYGISKTQVKNILDGTSWRESHAASAAKKCKV